MIKYLRLLLRPFSLLYGSVMRVRNFFYDKGIFHVARFDLPVIAVGNLTVGGTGKTPHVEYLLRLLNQYKVATLSRGYKRKSKGFLLANAHSTAVGLGDEPYQYHLDFPGVAVAVCEKRVTGVQQLQQLVPDLDLVVLDDAMQHRALQPSLNIMLTDYNRPFYRDFVLPAGLLREPRTGAGRAHAVIVSKCPANLDAAAKHSMAGRIARYTAPGTPVFFSSFKYGAPVAIGSRQQLGRQLIVLTGIANPAPLQAYLKDQGYQVQHMLVYPDHYQYQVQDMIKLKLLVEGCKEQNISVVTTRKDAVKLQDEALRDMTQALPLFYLPVEVVFGENAAHFDTLVLEHVQTKLRQAV